MQEKHISSQALTEQKPLFTGRALVALILPLMVEQLLAVTVGMADTLMVSGCGEAAVSGVNLVDSINILLIQLFAAMATGGAVVCSQYMGKGDPANASHAAKQLLYCTTFFALLLMTIAILLNQNILSLVFGSVEESVMGNAKIYFYYSAMSYPFLVIYNATAAFFRSMGKSRITLYISILMNLINVSGNALLIYGFQAGVAGAAIATLISRAVAAVLGMLLICRPGYPIHIDRLFQYRPDWKALGKILSVGIPTGLESSMFQLGKVMLSSLISTFGTAAIAANAMVNNLAGFSNVPGGGIGLGMITVVGQCMGAGRPEDAKKYAKKLLLATYLFMGSVDVILFVLAEPLCGLYHLSEEATVLGILLIQEFVFATVFWPVSFTIPNALRAAGDAKFTMVISLISMFVCRVALAYLLAYTTDLGLRSVWLAMYADWVVRGVFFLVRFVRGKWLKKKVI